MRVTRTAKYTWFDTKSSKGKSQGTALGFPSDEACEAAEIAVSHQYQS